MKVFSMEIHKVYRLCLFERSFKYNDFFPKYFSGNTTVMYGLTTVELQWLEHLWNPENMFETGVVRANEG